MEYTVQKLAKLAGVSARTLRYYDEFGLLRPCRVSSSGYRIYGEAEVDRLQQILFYRELGLPLEAIRKIVLSPGFDALPALERHRENLVGQREKIASLIRNVEKTIRTRKGEITMTDSEKFEGFKEKLIRENEEKYGAELREKYDAETLRNSNQMVKNMTKEQWERAGALAEEIRATLAAAFREGDPAGELAQKAVDLHRQWLQFYWPHYSKEAHKGLGQMYVDDPRFTAYYDSETPGTALFFRDAIDFYAEA